MKILKKKIALLTAVIVSASMNAQVTDTGTSVGVGIATPLTTLHVNAPTSIGTQNITRSALLVGTDTKGIGLDDNEIMNIGGNLHIGTMSPNDHLYFKVGAGQQRMVVRGDSGFVGIGTASPLTTLHLDAPTTIASSEISNAALLIGGTERGIGMDANEIMHVGGDFHIGTLDTEANLYLKVGAGQDRMAIKGDTGFVGIGTRYPDEKLTVDGIVHCKEIRVDLQGWADFVFAKEYALPTLQQVEGFIQQNGHLQGIPSEKEVLESGILLGGINTKLLQKIEELTLYTIAQEKEIKRLQAMEERLEQLEVLITSK